MNICILQTDNRPKLDYLLKTQHINKEFCKELGYDYLFIENNKYEHLHPATRKICVVYDFINNIQKYDILIFLDSDAWIQNGKAINEIISKLVNDENKHGCFSRDPYVKKNTYINSGSFILKINDYTRKMYANIFEDLYNSNKFHHNWPFDQYYISRYVFEYKNDFFIFVPDIINTPRGRVIRHNWGKTKMMHHDLDKLCKSFEEGNRIEEIIDIDELYDKEDFPNIHEKGYEYNNEVFD